MRMARLAVAVLTAIAAAGLFALAPRTAEAADNCWQPLTEEAARWVEMPDQSVWAPLHRAGWCPIALLSADGQLQIRDGSDPPGGGGGLARPVVVERWDQLEELALAAGPAVRVAGHESSDNPGATFAFKLNDLWNWLGWQNDPPLRLGAEDVGALFVGSLPNALPPDGDTPPRDADNPYGDVIVASAAFGKLWSRAVTTESGAAEALTARAVYDRWIAPPIAPADPIDNPSFTLPGDFAGYIDDPYGLLPMWRWTDATGQWSDWGGSWYARHVLGMIGGIFDFMVQLVFIAASMLWRILAELLRLTLEANLAPGLFAAADTTYAWLAEVLIDSGIVYALIAIAAIVSAIAVWRRGAVAAVKQAASTVLPIALLFAMLWAINDDLDDLPKNTVRGGYECDDGSQPTQKGPPGASYYECGDGSRPRPVRIVDEVDLLDEISERASATGAGRSPGMASPEALVEEFRDRGYRHLVLVPSRGGGAPRWHATGTPCVADEDDREGGPLTGDEWNCIVKFVSVAAGEPALDGPHAGSPEWLYAWLLDKARLPADFTASAALRFSDPPSSYTSNCDAYETNLEALYLEAWATKRGYADTASDLPVEAHVPILISRLWERAYLMPWAQSQYGSAESAHNARCFWAERHSDSGSDAETMQIWLATCGAASGWFTYDEAERWRRDGGIACPDGDRFGTHLTPDAPSSQMIAWWGRNVFRPLEGSQNDEAIKAFLSYTAFCGAVAPEWLADDGSLDAAPVKPVEPHLVAEGADRENHEAEQSTTNGAFWVANGATGLNRGDKGHDRQLDWRACQHWMYGDGRGQGGGLAGALEEGWAVPTSVGEGAREGEGTLWGQSDDQIHEAVNDSGSFECSDGRRHAAHMTINERNDPDSPSRPDDAQRVGEDVCTFAGQKFEHRALFALLTLIAAVGFFVSLLGLSAGVVLAQIVVGLTILFLPILLVVMALPVQAARQFAPKVLKATVGALLANAVLLLLLALMILLIDLLTDVVYYTTDPGTVIRVIFVAAIPWIAKKAVTGITKQFGFDFTTLKGAMKVTSGLAAAGQGSQGGDRLNWQRAAYAPARLNRYGMIPHHLGLASRGARMGAAGGGAAARAGAAAAKGAVGGTAAGAAAGAASGAAAGAAMGMTGGSGLFSTPGGSRVAARRAQTQARTGVLGLRAAAGGTVPGARQAAARQAAAMPSTPRQPHPGRGAAGMPTPDLGPPVAAAGGRGVAAGMPDLRRSDAAMPAPRSGAAPGPTSTGGWDDGGASPRPEWEAETAAAEFEAAREYEKSALQMEADAREAEAAILAERRSATAGRAAKRAGRFVARHPLATFAGAAVVASGGAMLIPAAAAYVGGKMADKIVVQHIRKPVKRGAVTAVHKGKALLKDPPKTRGTRLREARANIEAAKARADQAGQDAANAYRQLQQTRAQARMPATGDNRSTDDPRRNQGYI